MPTRVRLLLLRLLLWAGVPVLFWYTTDAPFGWIALWVALLMMVSGVRQKNALRFNLAWIFVLIGVAEVFLWAASPEVGRVIPGGFQRAYSGPHDVLGYAPIANRSGPARRVRGDETIYNVTYTIGAHGWRVAPPAPDPAATSSCLCFGCSFMFGEGVSDQEAMPYVLEGELGGRVRVYNLAMQGWGPHQMLAALESGIVGETVAEPPKTAIFLTSAGHAGRAAGRRRWDKRGPRYRVEASGKVTLVGTFADLHRETYWERRERKFLAKSWIVRALTPVEWQRVEPGDMDLWFAITRQARDYAEATWPGCKFHVLLWDAVPEADDEFVKRAKTVNLRVHRVSGILRGASEDWLPWSMDRYDPHPNVAAHAALAKYMATEIVGAGEK